MENPGMRMRPDRFPQRIERLITSILRGEIEGISGVRRTLTPQKSAFRLSEIAWFSR